MIRRIKKLVSNRRTKLGLRREARRREADEASGRAVRVVESLRRARDWRSLQRKVLLPDEIYC